MNEEKQLEFVNKLYDKYGIQDEAKRRYALESFNKDFDTTLKAFYQKYNPEKDVDWDYFGKIKNSYFSREPIMTVESANQPVEDLSNWESIKNTASNTFDAITAIPEDFTAGNMAIMGLIDKGIASAEEAGVPKEIVDGARKAYSYLTWLPQLVTTGEVSENVNTAIGKMSASSLEKTKDVKPTKEALEAFSNGDILGLATSAVDGFAGYIPSIIVAAGTRGGGFIPYFAGGGITSGGASKAESQDISIERLFSEGDADYVVPMAVGGLAGALEKYGLAKLGKAIMSGLNKTAMSKVKDLVVNTGRQGFINWLEAGMHKYVEEYSSHTSGNDGFSDEISDNTRAAVKAAEFLLSDEGFEAGAKAALGTAVSFGLGKGAAGFRSQKSKEKASELEAEQERVSNMSKEEREQYLIEKGERDYEKRSKIRKDIEDAEQVESELSDLEEENDDFIAASRDVKTGDPEMDNIVNNAISEAEQLAKVNEQKRLEEERESDRRKERERLAKEQEKAEKKKEQAQIKVDEEASKEVSKTVRDRASLKKALYTVLGLDETNQDSVEEVNTYANFFDGIIGARARREGISKREWYLSRFAPITATKDGEGKIETTFLEDGRAIVSALGKAKPIEFFREFSKVLQKDLTETESAALEAEFGIDFKSDFSEESFNTFSRALESYMESAQVPSGIKGNNASFIKAAFEKISSWMRDIKAGIEGESSLHINSNVRRIFDSIVTAQDIKQEESINAESTTEGEINRNVQPDRQDVVDTTGDVNQNQIPGGQATTNRIETKTVEKNEQKTEKSGKQGVSKPSQERGPKEKADARKRRDKIFKSAEKEFSVKKNGRIKGGDKALDNAKRGLIEISSDETAPAAVRKIADKRLKELNEVSRRAEETKKKYAERSKAFSEVKKKAESEGFSTKGLGVVSKNDSLYPADYDNGEVRLLNLETGEIETFSLSTGNTIKESDKEFKASSKRREESKKKSLETSKERSGVDEGKRKEAKSEVNRANGIEKWLTDHLNFKKEKHFKPVVDNVKSLLEKISGLNLDTLDEFADAESDASVESISALLSDYFVVLRDSLSPYGQKNQRTRKSMADKASDVSRIIIEFLDTQQQNLADGKRSVFDIDQIDSLREIMEGVRAESTGLKESYESINESKDADEGKLPAKLKGTVFDPEVKVQSVGEQRNRLGREIVGYLTSLMRSFGVNKPILAIDLSFFQDNNHPSFAGKTSEQREALIEAELIKVAEMVREADIAAGEKDIPGIDVYRNGVIKWINQLYRDPAGHIDASSFSIILYKSNHASKGKNGMEFLMLSLSHEFGHYLEKALFNNASQDTKNAVIAEYEKWLKETKDSEAIFSTAEAQNNIPATGQSKRYYSKFNEYFAEQVAYWLHTKKVGEKSKSPSNLVEKFFKGVADSIRRLFKTFKEKMKPSKSIDEFLSEHFDFVEKNLTRDSEAGIAKSEDSARKAYTRMVSLGRIMENLESFLAKTEPKSSKSKSEAKGIGSLISDLEFIVSDKSRSQEERSSASERLKALRESKKRVDEIAAKRILYKEMISSIDKEMSTVRDKIRDAYSLYALEGGVMSLEEFTARTQSFVEGQIKRDGLESIIERDREALERSAAKSIEGISKKEIEKKSKEQEVKDIEDEIQSSGFEPDGFDPIHIDFQKSNKKDSKPERSIYLDSISKAIDGKFKTKKEFKDLIKLFNKALEVKGIDPISKTESEYVLNNTRTGSLVKIAEPIVVQMNKKRTSGLKEVIDSFSATREERDAALAEADNMVKGADELNSDQIDRYNRLQLVGLYNSTIDERKKLLDSKVGDAIAKKEDSRVTERVNKIKNDRRIAITEAFYESVTSAKKLAKGVYELSVNGKKMVVKIYDRAKSYKPGEYVDHGGRIYVVKDELIEAMDSGFMSKLEQVGTINRHLTVASRNKKTFNKALTEKIRSISLSAHGIESLVDMISVSNEEGAFNSAISKMIGEDGFRKASLNVIKKTRAMESAYQDVARKAFGIKKDGNVNKKLFELRGEVREIKFKDRNGEDVSIDMTVGEMMTWYAYMGQRDLVKKFESMKERFGFDPKDERYWSDEKANAILKALKKEEKEFVKGIIQDVMPTIYDGLNKAHNEQFGYDLQLIDNYFPTQVDISETPKRQTSEMGDMEFDVANFLTTIGNKNIKDRRSNSPLKAGDFMSQFLNYANGAIYYSEYVDPVKKASLLFENQRYSFSGYMNTTFGKDIMNQIKLNLNNISAGRAANYRRNKIADTLRAMSISGAFMANLTMIPKQFSSFIALANGMSWRDFSKYYITVGPKRMYEDFREIMDMDFVKDRSEKQGRLTYDTYGLMLDNIAEEMRKSKTKRDAQILMAKMNNILFAPVKYGDLSAIIVGGMPLYRDLKKRAIKMFPGDSAKQKEWVEIKFAESVSRSQQSSDIMDQSDIQTQGGWAQLFVTFMSTPMLYGRILSGALRDIRKGVNSGNKKLIAKGMKTGALFSLIAPMMFQVASTGGELLWDSIGLGEDDDEEDQIRAWKYTIAQIGASFVQHIPVVYPAIQNIIDYQINDANFDPSFAAPVSIATKAMPSANKILAEIIEDGGIDFEDESTQRDINNVLRAVGVNYKGLKSLKENWGELITEGTVEDWRYLLGYSEWSLNR